MSSRRAARAGLPHRPSVAAGDAEPILTPVGDPRWRDPEWLAASFPRYFGGREQSRLTIGGRVDGLIRNQWAIAHGFTLPHQPSIVDWRSFGRFLKGPQP